VPGVWGLFCQDQISHRQQPTVFCWGKRKPEDQSMGNVSEELKEQARKLARKQLQKAKKVGERAHDAAQRKADVKKPDRIGRSPVKKTQK
jgi:hypothetical protein